MGKIITFYSYKGGVGRTMALANTAILLSQWGYSVLMIDFDLEAPGLPNFFKSFIDISVANNTRGLVDFLFEINGLSHASLLDALNMVEINLPHPMGCLSLVTAGKQDEEYFRKLQSLNFREFYSTIDGGRIVEEFREGLKSLYDYILVDSRTGLTDIGGICTVQLPDIIVLLFTPTNQAFEGGVDIVRRASKARQRLPYPRPLVPILPVPSRFDTQTEFILSQKWLDRFAVDLRDILSDWMPRGSSPRSLLEITKLPHISYFGFGETLPVIEQGVTDPSGLGFAYGHLENC
jgi:MinD-like ATPase involved in chromosome partitioning or flagellar assembly